MTMIMMMTVVVVRIKSCQGWKYGHEGAKN